MSWKILALLIIVAFCFTSLLQERELNKELSIRLERLKTDRCFEGLMEKVNEGAEFFNESPKECVDSEENPPISLKKQEDILKAAKENLSNLRKEMLRIQLDKLNSDLSSSFLV